MITCRDYQPLLGMYAIGRLNGPEATALQAHLDGCPMCRLEVSELRGVAEALSQADPDRVEPRPEPPPWLRASVFEQIGSARRKSRRKLYVRGSLLGLATAGALAAFLVLGPLAPGRGEPPAPGGQPTVAFSSGGVHAEATLSPRPYGTSLDLSVSGLNDGEQYMVWLERADGHRMPAGSFTARGHQTLRISLASGMRTENATALGLSAPGGGPPILRAPIPRP